MIMSKESEKAFVTTFCGDCKSNRFSVDHLKSSQEEADTRMLLHALDASQRGAKTICIQSPDTDVLVLALWCYKDLCAETSMLVGTGSGAQRRLIPLGPIYEALGNERVFSLPVFHAFSGCDQTGTFCGKSKQSGWNALQKSDDLIMRAFGNMGSASDLLLEDITNLERFVCQL
jgi:hypothetical protein